MQEWVAKKGDTLKRVIAQSSAWAQAEAAAATERETDWDIVRRFANTPCPDGDACGYCRMAKDRGAHICPYPVGCQSGHPGRALGTGPIEGRQSARLGCQAAQTWAFLGFPGAPAGVFRGKRGLPQPEPPRCCLEGHHRAWAGEDSEGPAPGWTIELGEDHDHSPLRRRLWPCSGIPQASPGLGEGVPQEQRAPRAGIVSPRIPMDVAHGSFMSSGCSSAFARAVLCWRSWTTCTSNGSSLNKLSSVGTSMIS